MKPVKKKIRRKHSKGVGGSKTNKLWQLVSILKTQKRIRRVVTLAKIHISITIKKTTISTIASSHKTSISLGNLYAGD